METQNVLIGSTRHLGSGQLAEDATREVEFVGEQLGEIEIFGINERNGLPTDTRGVTYRLYRTEDGRLLVHIFDWSKWQGEGSTWALVEVTDADLGPDGKYWQLGKESGFGRPLTLDEAMSETE